MWPTIFKLPWLNTPIRAYGLMLMIGFLGGTWWAARRAVRVKADPDLVVNVGFLVLISSVVGARLFYVIHYWDEHFAGRGLWSVVNVTAGGLEFYGGFLGAVVAGLVFGWIRSKQIRLYLDIIAPSVMFGMSMARIGCFLNGCCWGGLCSPELPWAVRFPFASPVFYRQWDQRLVTVPAELIYVNSTGMPYPIPRDLLAMSPEERHAQLEKQPAVVLPLVSQVKEFHLTPSEIEELAREPEHRSRHVHPVQLYAAVNGMVLALLLSTYFYRRKRHGMVFGWLLLLYPIVRVIEEVIRIDNPHDTAGLTVSQFISIVLVICGMVYIYAIRRLPLRSPDLVPYAAFSLDSEPKKRKE